jgi:LmbE family N-acetylglucosaminyl deacetylase
MKNFFSANRQFKQILCTMLILLFLPLNINGKQINLAKTNKVTKENVLQIKEVNILNESKGRRILIFAPHPDDEIVATGGLIYEALKRGFEIKIVFITNGDGFGDLITAQGHSRKTKIKSTNEAITLGYERQIEAIQAAKVLGLTNDNLIFLGYPDRGVSYLWFSHWSKLYTSVFTLKSYSPYNNSYTQKTAYKGENLSKDIRTIINSFKPDLIFTPLFFDMHPDHLGTSCFVISELANLEETNNGWVKNIKVYSYLVHYGKVSWPQEWGYRPSKKIIPPLELQRASIKWISFPLSEETVQIKLKAISEYKSQIVLIGGFLKAFVRTNELFQELTSLDTAFIIDPNTHLVKEEYIKVGRIKPLEINVFNKSSDSHKSIRFIFIGYKANLVLFKKENNRILEERKKVYLTRLNSQINKDKIAINIEDDDYKNLYAVCLNMESYFILPIFPLFKSNWIFVKL